MRVIIAGGGIAGLTLALSLRQVGIDCHVYEATPRLTPRGLGINLQPNAVRELAALGLADRLARLGILTAKLAFYNKHGQLVWSEPRGQAAGYRWPQIAIPRGWLHEVLLGAARERLGVHAIVTGCRLVRFDARNDKVVAHFVDPAGQPVDEAEGDLLVGADGIHSATRRAFYPGERPVFDGFVHYRGIVEADAFLTGSAMVVAGHRTQRVIVYPVGWLAGGRAVTNWLAYTRLPEGVLSPIEDWDTDADKAAFIDLFAGWTFPWLDVHGIMIDTEQVLQFPNVDRDPIPRWSFGRVTLIGDAAHPMQPIGAQAGSQAIVDARVLAANLMDNRDPAAALESYQEQRMAAMNAMIIRARNFGPETVMQLAEERAPNGFKHISDVLTREELENASLAFKKAAGLDVEAVNSHESYVPLPAMSR